MNTKEALRKINSWPEGLQRVYKVCARLVPIVMESAQCDSDEAQAILKAVLIEYSDELKSGRYTTVINGLNQTFDN